MSKGLDREDRGWRPPAWALALMMAADCAAAAALYGYYAALMSVHEPIMAHLAQADFSSIERITAWIAFLLAFLVIPSMVYTLFKGLKIPILATGKIGAMGNWTRLAATNLRLALIAAAAYSIFELIGAALRDGIALYAAGIYLAIALSWVAILTCASHANIWKGSGSPIKEAMIESRPLLLALPYAGAAIALILALSWISYLTEGGIVPYLMYALSLMAISACSNSYQWRLYGPDPESRR